MRNRTAIVLTAILGLWPAAAMAAEGGAAQQGSWLALLFYVINFAIFIYLIVRYAGPATSGFFRARANQIRGELGHSEADFQQAEQTARLERERLAALGSEKEQLLKELREEGAHEVARIGEMARAAAVRIRRDGELMAQATADRARREMRIRLSRAAVAAARDLVRASFESSDQVRLIDHFLDTVRRGARS